MRIDISLKQIGFILFFLGIALYSLFEARFLILGPHIDIQTPLHGETLGSPVVTASGNASNIAFLSLNDRQIYTNGDGSWSEKLIAPKGVSIITVRARDRFGRETEKSVHIVTK